ncbi:MAG: hydroxymethylbilane synthase [Ilumatobacteraceae bacterium]
MSDGASIRLATRGSAQARSQARAVADALVAATGRPAELVIVETTGDRRQDVPLHVIGGQGVFVKEVQQAVLDGRADVAVHSAKDLPSVSPETLTIGAFLARRDAADALVGRSLAELGPGAPVATGSVRRRAQLGATRPDLTFHELRGNILTRLDKVPDGGAIVMAVAALAILGRSERIAERLPVESFVPAVGQGCVAVEARTDDQATAELLAVVDDAATRHAVEVERSFLAELGSGCSLPVGGHVTGAQLHVFLAATDAPGALVVRDVVELGLDAGDHDLAREAAVAARRAVGWR